MMRIIVAEHFGMCFGVRDAIKHAEELAAAGPVTILGELVHNPVVRARLRALGAEEQGDAARIPRARVMVTAHGISDSRRRKLDALGLDVAHGTCPLVRQAHAQLRQLVGAGYWPVGIGVAGHVEVRGLTEDFGQAIVISDSRDITRLPNAIRFGVISQTTQPIDRVLDLVSEIRRPRPAAEGQFVDTICRPTKDRQRALKELLDIADTIVVVGGRKSNNTLELARTCKVAGRRVIHIERAEELDRADLQAAEIVGVTAGTSTLPETVTAVVARLNRIAQTR